MSNVLEEAAGLTSAERHEQYGHPRDNFARTAQVWSAILGVEVTARQVGLCMIGVKLAREAHRAHRDNLVDIAGYARTVEMLEEHKRLIEIVGEERA